MKKIEVSVGEINDIRKLARGKKGVLAYIKDRWGVPEGDARSIHLALKDAKYPNECLVVGVDDGDWWWDRQVNSTPTVPSIKELREEDREVLNALAEVGMISTAIPPKVVKAKKGVKITTVMSPGAQKLDLEVEKKMAAEVLKKLRARDPEPEKVDHAKDAKLMNDFLKKDAKITFVENKYLYNPVTDQYIVPLKSTGKTAVIDGWKHRGMLQAYTGLSGEDVSVEEMCRKYGFTRTAFEEYKKIFGWTHDSIPITDEQVENQDEESIMDDLKQARKFALYNRLTKEEWDETQRDALKWRELKNGQIDPFEQVLNDFNPTPLPKVECKALKADPFYDSKVLLIGLSDIHFGARADKDELVKGTDYNLNQASDIIHRYGLHIKELTTNDRMGYRFKKCVIAVVGDILHTLDGQTKKGTELEYDVLREKQFDAAMHSLIWFVSQMAELFPEVEVQVVKGNHAGVDEYILFRAVQQYFIKNANVKFMLHKARTAYFKINRVLFVMDHGESDHVKAQVPTGKSQETWIQHLMLIKPEMSANVDQKVFLQGDKHHFEHIEYNDFEYFMFSSPVRGDRYADHINKHSRPRQNALVVGYNGIEQVLHLYF